MKTDLRVYINEEQTAIIQACKRQDRKAQFRLYESYSGAMFNICTRMLKDHMEAENVLQNTFIDVFRKIDQFRFESTIGAWIKRITINNCLNQIKKRKLHWQSIEDNLENHADQEDETKDVSYTVEKIKSAVKQLPDGYKIVFNLYCMEGYDHEEIAEIVGISVSTSKSQLSRAKAKIRDLILQSEDQKNDYSNEGGPNRQIR